MKAVLQRVSRASVAVEGEVVSSIEAGFCVFVGIEPSDSSTDVAALVDKLAGLRVFPDAEGKMNLSIGEVNGAVMVVSQFTLLGDMRRGRRPSFSGAAQPEQAERLIGELVDGLRLAGLAVSSGVFGEHMMVELVNDGPVTLWLSVVGGRVE